MYTLIIDNHSQHLDALKEQFPKNKVITMDFLSRLKDIDIFELIVISGGSNTPTVLNHPEYYAEEIMFIKESTIPLLGICLGSELVVTAFGGSLRELDAKHEGEVTLTIIDPELQSDIGNSIATVTEGHRIAINNMPPEFSICAYSDHGIEIIKHNTRPIIAIQFHPEMSTDAKIIDWARATTKKNLPK